MPAYNYQVAKATLTEAEKDRILAIYLNTTDVSFPIPLPPYT